MDQPLLVGESPAPSEDGASTLSDAETRAQPGPINGCAVWGRIDAIDDHGEPRGGQPFVPYQVSPSCLADGHDAVHEVGKDPFREHVSRPVREMAAMVRVDLDGDPVPDLRDGAVDEGMRVMGVDDVGPRFGHDAGQLRKAEIVGSRACPREQEHGAPERRELAFEGTPFPKSADRNFIALTIEAARERDDDALQPANTEIVGYL